MLVDKKALIKLEANILQKFGFDFNFQSPICSLERYLRLMNYDLEPKVFSLSYQILKAALAVLIDEGADAFTLRRIAARCDMKVGNVSYHFPRKEMLIQVMLDEMLESYEAPALDPAKAEALRAYITTRMEDLPDSDF